MGGSIYDLKQGRNISTWNNDHLPESPHYDIAPVVLQMAEQIGIIQRELCEPDKMDVSIMRKYLMQIQNSLLDIHKWVDDLYRD